MEYISGRSLAGVRLSAHYSVIPEIRSANPCQARFDSSF